MRINLKQAYNNPEPNKNNTKKDNKDIIDQLNKLNDLYKKEILTKDEFEKAKRNMLE
jgi:hypothetical protein